MARSTRRPVISKAAARLTRKPRPNNRAKTMKGPVEVRGVFMVKNLNDHGPDSLREAVKYANSHPNTTIKFAVHGHTIKLTSGELVLTKDTTIEGPGAGKLAISGTKHSRVFAISSGITVTISGLKITDGRVDHKTTVIPCFGGGILNQGTLTLDDCVVSHNLATSVAGVTVPLCGYSLTGGAGGGGVANLGTLFICNNSRFIDNRALGALSSKDPPGNKSTYPGVAFGGGLLNVGMATAIVADCTFTGNRAEGGSDCTSAGIAGDAGGGAIANFGFTPTGAAAPPTPNVATLTISNSTFSKNQAKGGNSCRSPLLPGHTFGGAIGSHKFNGLAELNVSHCRFEQNQSVGGDFNVVTPGSSDKFRAVPSLGAVGGLFACGKATIIDSTFEHNETKGGQGAVGGNGGDARGGGIGFAFTGTAVNVVGCTIKNNSAIGGLAGDGGGGGSAWGAGVGITANGPNVTMVACTIENNEAQGGDGRTQLLPSNGGDALGGGVFIVTDPTMGTATTLMANSVTNNQVTGGNGLQGGSNGQAAGPNVYLYVDP